MIDGKRRRRGERRHDRQQNARAGRPREGVGKTDQQGGQGFSLLAILCVLVCFYVLWLTYAC